MKTLLFKQNRFQPMFSSKIIISLFLFVAVMIVYWQVSSFEFVAYDDSEYIALTSKKLSLETILWSFRTIDFANWHPLTWLSLILDYNLYGSDSGGYHITNLFFHVANTLILFFLLNKMTGGLYQSAFVAALFALHPLHVESVAWVSERKGVLSTFFWLLTMWAYVHYIKAPDWKNYLRILFFFSLGLMAKPMLVTVPFVLLLMDYWPLGRMKLGQIIPLINSKTERKSFISLILEKTPLFVLTIFSCGITYIAQNKYNTVASFDHVSLTIRLLNAVNSYAVYLRNTLCFHKLGVFYPYTGKFNSLEIVSSILLIISLCALAVVLIKQAPYFSIGWFWFLGTLIPVIGIIQVGSQAMADRYMYIPLIGLSIGLSWGVAHCLQGIKFRKMIISFALAIFISVMMYSTYNHVKIWRNTICLFEHALEFNQKNYSAYNIAGVAIAGSGDYAKALYYFYMALNNNPKYDPAYVNAGNVLQKMGKLDDAMNCYLNALRINNKSAEAQYNLGIIFILKSKPGEAINHLTEALKISPDDADVHNNLGIALIRNGKIPEGLKHLQKALYLNPNNSEFQKNVSKVFSMQKAASTQ
jgi:protein O-mannosyl-transferase